MGAFLFLLLAVTLQSTQGTLADDIILYYDETDGNYSMYYSESGEELFPYEDYYDDNTTYEYLNYSHFEVTRKMNSTGSGRVLLPSYCLFFATHLHVLHFLHEDL